MKEDDERIIDRKSFQYALSFSLILFLIGVREIWSNIRKIYERLFFIYIQKLISNINCYSSAILFSSDIQSI